MANLRKPNTSYFGLISGSIGLALCVGQSYRGHVDARHERERMQEMHEQKMHYLHEFHRQQLHAKDHRIAAMEAEKRAVEAERLAGMYSEKVRRDGNKGGEGAEGFAGVGGAGEQRVKEREMLRMMGAARQDEARGGDDGKDGRDGV